MDCRVEPGNDDFYSSFRGDAKHLTRNLEIPGSRWRAPRNDRWNLLHQPAALGDAAQMIIGVAKTVLDHGQPLEVVADLGLHGHADAAMELDRLLADELCRLADLHFRGRH